MIEFRGCRDPSIVSLRETAGTVEPGMHDGSSRETKQRSWCGTRNGLLSTALGQRSKESIDEHIASSNSREQRQVHGLTRKICSGQGICFECGIVHFSRADLRRLIEGTGFDYVQMAERCSSNLIWGGRGIGWPTIDELEGHEGGNERGRESNDGSDIAVTKSTQVTRLVGQCLQRYLQQG